MEGALQIDEDPALGVAVLATTARSLFADSGAAEAVAASVSSRTRDWKYASGPWFTPLDPLGPELAGISRGRLLEDADSDQASHHFALDEHGRVSIERAIVNHNSMRCTYYDFESSPCIALHFSETRDGNFRKLERAHAFYMGPYGIRLSVGYGSSRVESVVEVEADDQLKIHCRCTYRYPKSSRRPERVVDSVAILDHHFHPVSIRDAEGTILYQREPPCFDILEDRGVVLLEDAVLDVVRAGARGAPVVAVALVHGNGPESFPPQVWVLYDDEFRTLMTRGACDVWDPSSWEDRLGSCFDLDKYAELREFAQANSRASVRRGGLAVTQWVINETCRRLQRDNRWNLPTRFSTLVCYPVNIEDGFQEDTLSSWIDSGLRSEIEELTHSGT
jgi:hypothetical protein